jgi:hypothetical protein
MMLQTPNRDAPFLRKKSTRRNRSALTSRFQLAIPCPPRHPLSSYRRYLNTPISTTRCVYRYKQKQRKSGERNSAKSRWRDEHPTHHQHNSLKRNIGDADFDFSRLAAADQSARTSLYSRLVGIRIAWGARAACPKWHIASAVSSRDNCE